MPWEELHPFKSFSESKREQIIQEGVDLFREQAKPNLSAVKRFLDTKHSTNVCLGTIRNRASGAHQDARKGHKAQQLLSPVQENILIEWIILLSDTGHCISKRTLRKKAEVLCGHKPGQTWIRSFLSRHPEIVLGKPSGLDPKRAQAFNKPTVKRHLELLEEIIKKYGIPPENIYNMDEKGVQRGGGRKAQAQKFLVPRSKRPKYKLRSANLELVTIVDCVAADGGCTSPAIIFEGKQQYERAWFDVDPKISIGLSDNGWTSDFHCYQWFKDTFIPQATERNTSGKPILLIYDGHGSHEKYELLRLAKEHNVILFSLPPHTTHKLQPLDVGIFGPFARAWTERCDDYMEEHLEEIPRDQFVKHYMEVRQNTFKATTIRAAFRKSGAWPINHNLFTDADFAPSINTSSMARDVPDSYPVYAEEWPTHQSWSDDEPEPESDSYDEGDGNHEGRDTRQTQQDTIPAATESLPPSDAAPIPPARFYSKAPKPSQRGRDTEVYISALEGEVAMLRQENAELAAHATLAFDHVRGLKHRLNAKGPSSKRRKLNTDSRWLNSEEGLVQCERQEAEEREKAAQKQARVEARQAEHVEQQRRREGRDPDEPFVGSLNSQRKAGLQDIAYSLCLDIEGTVEDLKSRIYAFFEEHEGLRTDPRYIRLFPQIARQTRQAASTYTSAPSNSHDEHSDPQPEISNNQDIDQDNQYNHFTTLAHNTQSNHAQGHSPAYHSISPYSPYHASHFNRSSHPGYIAHIPSYYNVNSYPSH